MLSDFEKLASTAGELLRAKSYKLVTAESCTGGLLSAAITSVAGSSKWFERGFVTYSNESKQEVLGVQTVEEFGAVSEQTACAMARGALKNSHAEVSLAITGVAGPDGGTKSVGTVWIACAVQQLGRKRPRLFPGLISPARETRADGDQREALHCSPLDSPSPLTRAQTAEIFQFKDESTHAMLYHFKGDRQSVREQAVSAALNLLFDALQL